MDFLFTAVLKKAPYWAFEFDEANVSLSIDHKEKS